eukprot:TRINITY_DN2490_c0_g1_i3.p1 TRINITY_DN2490_c0_g1~~TRINITY_DN2490_c0_g1_i3.p1  ORF type:complete len:678 (+),score=198.83 TRINITY_DN2490_c0_g1_i3:250-2283(+)
MGCGSSAQSSDQPQQQQQPQRDPQSPGNDSTQNGGRCRTPPPAGARNEITWLSKLEIVGGMNLPAMDRGGKSDPFVVVTFGRHVFRTSTCKKDVNPRWEQLVVFFVTALEQGWDIFFEVYDEDVATQNDFMASAQVKISLLCGGVKDLQLPLSNKRGEACGTLIIRAEILDQSAIEKLYWGHLFAMFDKDGSRTLDKDELVQMLEVIGHSDIVREQARFDELFNKADKDKSGNICSDEFFELAVLLCGGRTLPPEMAQGSELKDIVEQASELMEGKVSEGDHFDSGLAGRPEDLIWYIGLLMLGLGPGKFSPSQGSFRRSGAPNPVMKLILSESHAMTPEGAAGVSGDGGVTDKDEGVNLGATIFYQNRLTGRMEVEKIPGYVKTGMRMVYGTKPALAAKMLAKITKQQGAKNDDPKSKKNIPAFIKFHGIDMAECLQDVSEYKTFNEFFYRKLKPGARPLAHSGPGVLLCPADARTNVFSALGSCTELWVKGREFTLTKLLGGGAEADRIMGYLGANPAICVSRLAPQDYHRFHCACGGKLLSKRSVEGEYYTVNPIAIRSAVDVFGENARCVLEIDSGEENFGTYVHIAVGATCVASITIIPEVGSTMQTGDDFGYFAFGGSTCITLYKEGSVVFADDLALNSVKPIETLTRVGQVLGARDRETLDAAMKAAATG